MILEPLKLYISYGIEWLWTIGAEGPSRHALTWTSSLALVPAVNDFFGGILQLEKYLDFILSSMHSP